MKIALGTVQFGLNYGISNTEGQVGQDQVGDILARAHALGVDMLDTAEAYGEAETVLGKHKIDNFDLVGKIGRLDVSPDALDSDIRTRLDASLKRLGVGTLYGLLLHAPAQLLEKAALAKQIARTLTALKAEGLVQKIGISTYGPEETIALLDILPIDLVQLPLSPIDRRWRDTGLLAKLKAHDIEVHVRSVYLQGLLLMPLEALPDWSAPWHGLLAGWHDWVCDTGHSAPVAAMALTQANQCVDRAVIGVQTADQLSEAFNAIGHNVPPLPEALMTDDSNLLNPSLWGRSIT